jgi:DNA polymerase III subunit beta
LLVRLPLFPVTIELAILPHLSVMKFLCQQSDLSSSLSLVSRAVSGKPSLPILTNIKLVATAGRVQLTGFDLSLGIQTSFEADVSEAGEIALPAKLLNDIVSRLPSGEMSIEQNDSQNGDGIVVTVKSKTGTYQVRGMDATEFPELPEPEDGAIQHLPIAALIDGLRGALIACSQDETKPILTGVNFKLEAEKLEFAATDGHRLGVVETFLEAEQGVESTLELTVPARALRELEKMLGGKQSIEKISFSLGEGQAVFAWETAHGQQQLITRTIEGNYPDYRALIPSSFGKQVTIDRKQLVSALERIAVLADQHNNLVKFTISNEHQSLDLSVEAQDIGSGRESLTAQVSGEDIEIAFNVRYLLDGLKNINAQDVAINLNGVLEQVVFSPVGGVKTIYLVMPVQIRS